MDSAKKAVQGFLAKDGKHDTTVHETVNPAVQNEHVTRTQHNETVTAVDREVHQDHYHTSVQPIKDREVLPEQHTHQVAAVQERNIDHGNDAHVRERLEAERAQFKNTREVGEIQHTTSTGPVIGGEHVHHHVHETIQPVIQKETIQNSVVHTTIPIHEVHHNEAKHHSATALPAVSMAEFQKQGGSLGGREERTDAFAGEPRAVGGTLGGAGASGTTSLTEKSGHTSHTGSHTTGTHTTGTHTTGSHTTGSGAEYTSGSSTGNASTHASTGTSSHGKPSLLDKLNPMKDSDGDGKAGFMK